MADITACILKVQASLFTSGEKQRVLIYDEGKKHILDDVLSRSLKKLLNGRDKAYFYGSIRSGTFYINEEAPEQDW